MAKKRKKQRQQRGYSAPSRARHSQLARLIHQGKLEQARDALRAILQRDPSDVEALSLLAMAASGLEDLQSMWFAMTRMAIQRPDDADTWFHAAMACYANMLPFSTLHYGTQFLTRWPDHPEVDELRNFMPRIEALCETIREEYGIAAGQSDEGLMLFEEGRLLLEQGYYNEGRRVSEMAVKLAPDAAPPLNNLSLSYMIEGKLDRALEIAEQVLERFPGNLHAQANQMQFLLRLGRRGEAEEIARRLRTLKPESADDWHKLIEAFTYLGDDGTVVALYEDLQKVTDDASAADSPLIQHWAAVAYSRWGDDKQARKLWQKALKSLPDFPVVEENLAELKKPAGERAKAWPFAFQQWVPRVWIEEFLHIAMTERSENVLARKIQQVFERNPALAASIPILLERGDASGREFALRAAIILDLPVLVEFALSDQGADEERLRAAQAAAEVGLLPRGRAVPMWNKGKLTEMILMAYEIHEEPPSKHPPHRVQALLQRAFDAQMNAEFEDSLKLIDEALALAPGEPTVMNHKAAVLGLLGRGDEARAVVEQTAAMHPDYLFARCAMAEFLAHDGRLEEAHEWLDPLLERPRFHISEFGALCKAQIEVLLAEGKTEGAKTWLQMFEQADPDHRLLPYLRQRVKKGR